jgi:hypothetical protein
MVTSTATAMNAMVDNLKSLITASATALGLNYTGNVWEWDEHPAIPAERGDLPVAYVIPVMEDGDIIRMKMGAEEAQHEFSVTVVCYYKGSEDTASQIRTDLRTHRNYAYAFRDIFRYQGNYFGSKGVGYAHIKEMKLDFGYWVPPGGTPVIHFWIAKMKCVTII